MNYYWTSWWVITTDLDKVVDFPFNWCITGSTLEEPARSSICCEIRSDNEEAVWNLISQYFIINEKRFCSIKENPGVLSGRFSCLKKANDLD